LVIDRKKGQFNEEDKKIFDEAANAAGYLLATLRLYEREKYETLYLNAIGEVAKELQKELDLKLILVNAIKSFKTFMKCDDISVAKIDEINNSGVVIASTYIRENTKFTLADGLVGFIGKHKNAIIKDNLHEGNLVVLKKSEKTPNTSFVGVPIKQEDELLGVIWLEDHRKKKFNKEDLEPLYILSSQLSLAWQRAKLYYKVKDLVILDGLTELYNHRHFQETLEDEIDKSKELVLMMVDIDHFKRINDTYGHLAGDEVLKILGKIIKNYGIAARYGGEEFAIILPKHSIEKGLRSAYTLKSQIKNAEIKLNKGKISITVSIGVAHYPKDAKTKVELVDKADKALYMAKEKGRDKVVAAQTIGQNQES
jgi:two-component system cell cycle response regulator